VDVSTQVDVENVPIINIKISEDKKKVSLIMDGLKEGFIYELKFGDIKAQRPAIGKQAHLLYTQ